MTFPKAENGSPTFHFTEQEKEMNSGLLHIMEECGFCEKIDAIWQECRDWKIST